MSENASQFFRYGLSLPGTDVGSLQEINSIPEVFELIELSGELIRDISILREKNALFTEFSSINFRNLLPENLTCQLTTAPAAIIAEYKKQLRELLGFAHECNAQTVSIDPDWTNLVAEKSRRQIFDDVLRSTAGDREYNAVCLALAVRIPHTGVQSLPESVDLLHKLANYRVKLVLDINPHELLGREIDWLEELKIFRFSASHVRFCYPSELGNKLLYKHIEQVIKALKSWKREVPIYIAPSGKANFDELADLVKTINSESF